MRSDFPVRNPSFTTEDPGAVLWIGGRPCPSLIMNAFGCFGSFERLTVMIVRGALPSVRDPELKQRAKHFIGQEQAHLRCHHDEVHRQARQGLKSFELERGAERLALRHLLPRLSEPMRLSWIAAFELYTTKMARFLLDGRWDVPGDHPAGAFLLWHAAEEVEHRCVAHDLLVDRGVGWTQRTLGLALASLLIPTLLVMGMFWQAHQLGLLFRPSFILDVLREFFKPGGMVPSMLSWTFEYLRPSYDPAECDYVAESQAILAQYNAAEGAS